MKPNSGSGSVAGIGASHYSGMLEVRPNGAGSVVDWHVEFLASHQATRALHALLSRMLDTGLESLKSRFGVVP